MHTLKGALPLGSNWVEEFVGSKFTCASCQHAIVMVRMLFTSRSDLITLRVRSRHPAQWPCSKIRACERRSLEQQGPLGQPSEAFTQVWWLAAFGGTLRSGLTPDDFAPRSEVVERTESFL